MIDDDAGVTGFNRHLGMRLVEWAHEHCVMELTIEPRHLNRAGVVHGGVLTTLIDAVGSHAGNYAADPSERARSVTVALTTQFTGQAREGVLRAHGVKVGGGKQIFFAHVDIFAPDESLIAYGDITGRVFRTASSHPSSS